MKKCFFQSLFLASFFALGATASFGQEAAGAVNVDMNYTGDGVKLDIEYHVMGSERFEESMLLFTSNERGEGKAIGTATIANCGEGHLYLPDGVPDLKKAKLIIFRSDDGKSCGEIKIEFQDSRKSTGIEVKLSGVSVTLSEG